MSARNHSTRGGKGKFNSLDLRCDKELHLPNKSIYSWMDKIIKYLQISEKISLETEGQLADDVYHLYRRKHVRTDNYTTDKLLHITYCCQVFSTHT